MYKSLSHIYYLRYQCYKYRSLIVYIQQNMTWFCVILPGTLKIYVNFMWEISIKKFLMKLF